MQKPFSCFKINTSGNIDILNNWLGFKSLKSNLLSAGQLLSFHRHSCEHMIDNVHQLLGKHNTGKSRQWNWQQLFLVWFTGFDYFLIHRGNNWALSSWCLRCELDNASDSPIDCPALQWFSCSHAGHGRWGRCELQPSLFGTKAVKDPQHSVCSDSLSIRCWVFLQLHPASYHSSGYIRWRQARITTSASGWIRINISCTGLHRHSPNSFASGGQSPDHVLRCDRNWKDARHKNCLVHEQQQVWKT